MESLRIKILKFGLVAFLAAATSAAANEFAGAMQAFVDDNIVNWATDPVIVSAIKAQNTETAGYDQAMIDQMDQLWRAQVGMGGAEMIDDVLSNPAAEYLCVQVAAAEGAITEAFVMDALGLNVAASAETSDYWQGDEAKFQQTYLVGADAVHIGDIELDDSTNTVQGQVSMTIVDSETGDMVGALTVGINLSALAQ